jgi:antitoxin (DNA-binding transcriptional repressor) of toxin-antitoxin stability system
MAPLTVSASEARTNFSKLGERIVQTGEAVTVFKNSKPWLVISPAQARSSAAVAVAAAERKTESENVSAQKEQALRIAMEVEDEYFSVFEALAK